jgi:hypothetical protein
VPENYFPCFSGSIRRGAKRELGLVVSSRTSPALVGWLRSLGPCGRLTRKKFNAPPFQKLCQGDR